MVPIYSKTAVYAQVIKEHESKRLIIEWDVTNHYSFITFLPMLKWRNGDYMENNTKKSKVIAVIGGDNRQGYLAASLSDDGYTVFTNGLEKLPTKGGLGKVTVTRSVREAVSAADVVILPMPVSRDNITVNAPYSYHTIYLSDVVAAVKPEQLITGGIIKDEFRETLDTATLVDYLAREELAVMNAIPTAEGAIEIAMRECEITLFGAECLIIGNGRIGKVLSKMLTSLNANVTVSARKQSDFAWIKAGGAAPVNTADLYSCIGKYDIIFNTVPHLILTKKEIKKCKENALIIDLASAPGGVDFESAEMYKIKAIQALSLPGKVAPISAAAIIKDTILNIMNEVN